MYHITSPCIQPRTQSNKPHKLPKIETDQLAVIDRMDQGPQFGPGDLKILLQRGSSKKV